MALAGESGQPSNGGLRDSLGLVALHWLQKHYRVVLLIGGLVAAILIGAGLANVLNPVIFSFLLAYILNPVVNFFERRHVNRTLIVASIIVFFFWFLAIALIVVGSVVEQEFNRFVQALPSEAHQTVTPGIRVDERLFFLIEESADPHEPVMFDEKRHDTLLRAPDWQPGSPTLPRVLHRMEKRAGVWQQTDELVTLSPDEYARLRFAEFIDNGNHVFDSGLIYELDALVRSIVQEWNEAHPQRQILVGNLFTALEDSLLAPENQADIRNFSLDILSFVGQALGQGVSTLFYAFLLLSLIPMYTFFFLRGMNAIRDRLVEYIPSKHRRRILDLAFEIHLAVGSFFRGRLVIALIVGTATWAGLAIVGVPFALLIGVVNGVIIVIPFASTVLLGPVLLVTYLTYDPAVYNLPNLPLAIVGVIVVFAIVQWGEQFFLVPVILGKEVELHPVVLLIAIFTGAELLGLFGILIAVPVASVIKILSREFLLPRLKDMARDPTPTPSN